jgi:hypothetical protein
VTDEFPRDPPSYAVMTHHAGDGAVAAATAALSLLGRPLPPAFALRVVTLAPGGDRAFAPAEWHDAVAVVERGSIELEDAGGARLRLERGAVLAPAGLRIRNPGREPAVLALVRRRAARPPGSARAAGGG